MSETGLLRPLHLARDTSRSDHDRTDIAQGSCILACLDEAERCPRVDFAADDSDPMPGVIHALSEIYLGLKSVSAVFALDAAASSKTPRVLAKGPS